MAANEPRPYPEYIIIGENFYDKYQKKREKIEEYDKQSECRTYTTSLKDNERCVSICFKKGWAGANQGP